MEFANGDAVAPLKVVGDAGGKRGTEVTFLPSTADLHDGGVRFRDARAPPARARLPQFRRHHRALRQAPRGREARGAALRGRRRGVREISRPQQDAAGAQADHAQGGQGRHQRRVRAVVEQCLPRERAVLHQQHPAARRRHASRRLPRRPDAPGHRLCREDAERAQGKGRADRRRLPRRPDRGPLRQGAGPEILLADQGQARLLRGAAGGRERRQRRAQCLVRGAPGRGQGDRRQGGRGRRRARSRPQGTRPHAQQGQRHHLAARQARRLPGTRSHQGRTPDRRGRLGRRLGQDGARPRVPGGAAAARQDPQRGARAAGKDAFVRADRHADHGARRGHQPRNSPPTRFATTRSSS